MKDTLFYFKRTIIRRGGETTTEFGIGSALLLALVLLVLGLAGKLVSIPSLVSLLSRFAR